MDYRFKYKHIYQLFTHIQVQKGVFVTAVPCDINKILYSVYVYHNEGTCHQYDSVAHYCVFNHFRNAEESKNNLETTKTGNNLEINCW